MLLPLTFHMAVVMLLPPACPLTVPNLQGSVSTFIYVKHLDGGGC